MKKNLFILNCLFFPSFLESMEERRREIAISSSFETPSSQEIKEFGDSSFREGCLAQKEGRWIDAVVSFKKGTFWGRVDCQYSLVNLLIEGTTDFPPNLPLAFKYMRASAENSFLPSEVPSSVSVSVRDFLIEINRAIQEERWGDALLLSLSSSILCEAPFFYKIFLILTLPEFKESPFYEEIHPQSPFFYCQKAALLGFRAAQKDLGIFYAEGKVIPKNEQESLKWHLIAGARGDLDSLLWLRKIPSLTFLCEEEIKKRGLMKSL